MCAVASKAESSSIKLLNDSLPPYSLKPEDRDWGGHGVKASFKIPDMVQATGYKMDAVCGHIRVIAAYVSSRSV